MPLSVERTQRSPSKSGKSARTNTRRKIQGNKPNTLTPERFHETYGTSLTKQTIFRYRKVRDAEAGGLPNIKAEGYFHGFITPERAAALFNAKIEGSFLVRQLQQVNIESKSKAAYRKYVILIMYCGVLQEIMIRYSRRNRVYYLNEVCFSTPAGLIAYHRDKMISIDRARPIYLGEPIRKPRFEVNHEQISRIKRLGDGAFGEVFRGRLRTGYFTSVPVAVKILNGRHISVQENEQLLKEAQMMCSMMLSHENIVDFLGIACYESPIMILMELCKGALLDTIQKTGDQALSIGEKIHYCLGTAKGLEFLHSDKAQIIHRDIAARNSLIGFDNEAKISDFGLSVFGTRCKEKKLKKVPIRYLAPETLRGGLYTPKTDVWSFGVLMWEVFNEGKEPYEDIQETREVKKAVINGRRLVNNGSAPAEVWAIAERCFDANYETRPSAAMCVEWMSQQYVTTNKWVPTCIHEWTGHRYKDYIATPTDVLAKTTGTVEKST